MSLKTFLGLATKIGMSSPNKFQVILPVPGSGISTVNLSLMCETGSLPGRGFSTSDAVYNGGKMAMPNGVLYNVDTFTFSLTQFITERKAIDDWMEKIVDPKTKKIAYHDEYTTSIIINKLDNTEKPIGAYILKEAWPVELRASEMASDLVNQVQKMAVSFAYKRFEKLF